MILDLIRLTTETKHHTLCSYPRSPAITSIIKNHNHGNLEKKEFIWAYTVAGVRVQDSGEERCQVTGMADAAASCEFTSRATNMKQRK